VEYHANKKAWMTSDIFCDWVKKLEKKMTKKKRKIALIIDNCPAHPKIPGLQAIDLLFLPPNTMSKTQPMDQGIIQNLKVHYRKRVLVKFIAAIDKDTTPNINLLDALHLLSQAWNCVTPSTIANCFRHAGFAQSDSLPIEEDFDIEDNIPLAKLRQHGLNPEILEKFTTVDKDIQTCATLTDDDIIEEIKMNNTADPMEEEIVDDSSDTPIRTPTIEETTAACNIMRRYLENKENSEDILHHLNVITDVVNCDYLTKPSQQAKIISFFKKHM
jgi:hypothetical protein